MEINLTQYQDMVTLDSQGAINILAIEYSGKMEININVDVRKVKMTDNKITIYFNRGTEINDALFYYTGWIDIKRVIYYGVHGKRRISKRLIDSSWGRLSNNWEDVNNNWEFYDAHIGKTNERQRSVTYNYKGIKIKRTPKTRGLRHGTFKINV